VHRPDPLAHSPSTPTTNPPLLGTAFRTPLSPPPPFHIHSITPNTTFYTATPAPSSSNVPAIYRTATSPAGGTSRPQTSR
jgi:hypothetical protein